MALVFNIQRFSVHDGPGIRTTVFLKGCNLACRWCHNPESIEHKPQLQYFLHKCTGCKACEAVCPKSILRSDKDLSLCTLCGACVHACMADALKVAGKEYSASDVMEIVRKDIPYYKNSGGGLTVSGGEPLLQPDFCSELLSLAKKEGIHTAIDTAGNVPFSAIECVLPYTDAILYDLKTMDDNVHRQYTGASNQKILQNLERLFLEDISLYIRVPVIKDVNDSIENAHKIAQFLKNGNNIVEIKLLPYHSLGADKAQSIGHTQYEFSPPEPEQLSELARAFHRPVVY